MEQVDNRRELNVPSVFSEIIPYILQLAEDEQIVQHLQLVVAQMEQRALQNVLVVISEVVSA